MVLQVTKTNIITIRPLGNQAAPVAIILTAIRGYRRGFQMFSEVTELVEGPAICHILGGGLRVFTGYRNPAW